MGSVLQDAANDAKQLESEGHPKRRESARASIAIISPESNGGDRIDCLAEPMHPARCEWTRVRCPQCEWSLRQSNLKAQVCSTARSHSSRRDRDSRDQEKHLRLDFCGCSRWVQDPIGSPRQWRSCDCWYCSSPPACIAPAANCAKRDAPRCPLHSRFGR